jgi:hypothetical protein
MLTKPSNKIWPTWMNYQLGEWMKSIWPCYCANWNYNSMDLQKRHWSNAPGKLITFFTDMENWPLRWTGKTNTNTLVLRSLKIQTSSPHSIPFPATTVKNSELLQKKSHIYYCCKPLKGRDPGKLLIFMDSNDAKHLPYQISPLVNYAFELVKLQKLKCSNLICQF